MSLLERVKQSQQQKTSRFLVLDCECVYGALKSVLVNAHVLQPWKIHYYSYNHYNYEFKLSKQLAASHFELSLGVSVHLAVFIFI